MGLFRSFLFAPGSEIRKAEKALTCGADAVIFDLEDAVAMSEKAAARKIIADLLRKPRPCLAYVRVNGVATGLTFDDLKAVVINGLDGAVLPKTESADDIEKVDRLISELETKREIPAGQVDLMPLIETARGLWYAESIMKGSRRIRRVAFGSGDFIFDLGGEWCNNGLEVIYARSRLVVASRVAGIEQPIDAVFPDIKDDDGLLNDARLGRRLGFQGKLVIHPRQVESVNSAYSPTLEEVENARRVIAAFDDAEKQGLAAIQLDGKMIDYPVVTKARQLIARAEAIAKKSQHAYGEKICLQTRSQKN